MGGKHERRRHPGIAYLTGLILILVLFSGCSMRDMFRSKDAPDEIRLQEQIRDWETQVMHDAFHEAVQTNQQILETLRDRKPQNIHSDDLLYQQALACQALLDQILAHQTKQRRLAEQLHRTRRQLTQKNLTIDSLKTLIKNLNQTIHTLEIQKNRLEEQIERMKQIDLK